MRFSSGIKAMSLDDLKGKGGRKQQLLKVNRGMILAYHEQFGREATCRAFYMSERTLDRILGKLESAEPELFNETEDRVRRLEYRQDGYEQTQDIMRTEWALSREDRLEQLRAVRQVAQQGRELLEHHRQWYEELAQAMLDRVRPILGEILRAMVREGESPEYQALIEGCESVDDIMRSSRNPSKIRFQRTTLSHLGLHNIYDVSQDSEVPGEPDDSDIVEYPAEGLDGAQPGTDVGHRGDSL